MLSAKHKSGIRLLIVLSATIFVWAPRLSVGQERAAGRRKSFDPPAEWRPTHAPAGARYLGNEACAACHAEATTQPATPMGRALEPAHASRILREHPRLLFREGPFTYAIERRGEESVYVVTKGSESLSLPISYGFGQGKVGQTYVLEYLGRYYESRVSYYGALGGLDYTPGAPRSQPISLEGAIGRQLDQASVNDCFSCHATRAVVQGRLSLGEMTPGITCEGCHGPGEFHVAAVRTPANERGDLRILNPGRFDTEGMTQFCGACHRSWIHVQTLGIRGVENVRFQPYRLFNSKCYDHADPRISCVACHNPHEELRTEPAFYDDKCLTCHATSRKNASAAKRAPACPAGARNCASCHMPKIELPGAHHSFTDHQIRIFRKGAPYPN